MIVAAGQIAATRRWPSTTGTIDGADFQRIQKHQLGGPRRRGHEAVVSYSYTVADSQYDNDRIWPGLASTLMMDSFANAFYDPSRWQPGMQVPVYYDPGNPSRAVLDRSFSPVEKSFVVFAVLGLVLSVLPGRRTRE